MKFYIGTSGWHYDSWKEKFYPKDLPKDHWLKFYAENFNSLEINNTFYRTVNEKTAKSWHNETPKNFKFTIKGSRYITHIRRLNVTKEPLKIFYESIKPLKNKVVSILWQLPPSFKKDLPKLELFCKVLEKNYINVFEFRNPSWFDEETYNVFRENKIVLCTSLSPDHETKEIYDFQKIIYLRFHGIESWYSGEYGKKIVKKFKKKAMDQDAKIIFAYFNNDMKAASVKDATTFKNL